MKILVTGSSGFIGRRLVNNLILDEYDVIVSDFNKWIWPSSNFIYPEDVYSHMNEIDIVVHLGATSETNSDDEYQVFKNNTEYTINLLSYLNDTTKFIYASSAAVYGNGADINIVGEHEDGDTIYAKSKLAVDQEVRKSWANGNVVGLRLFNVCGFYGEDHKKQPSPTFRFRSQLEEYRTVKLFYGSNEIYRDFIYITDVIDIIKFLFTANYKHPVINVGTGVATSFEDIARLMIKSYPNGKIEYIDPPENLTHGYQTYTRADISTLRDIGYDKNIPSILEHIKRNL